MGVTELHSFTFVSGISDYQRAVRRKSAKEQAPIRLSVRNSNLFYIKKEKNNDPESGCSLVFTAAHFKISPSLRPAIAWMKC